MSSHLPALDGLRALAVAGVCWFHWAPRHQFGLPWASGVSLFFVISGFLITGILLDRRSESIATTLRHFYARRSLRIFPLFYLTLAVAALLNVPLVREHLGWHVLYLSNFLTALEHVRTGPLQHFWSLSVEEQFYLVWPLLMLFTPSRGLPWLIVGTILSAPAFKLFMALKHPEIEDASMLPFSCLDTLGIGALLAWLSRRSAGLSVLSVARIMGGIGFPLTLLLGIYRAAIGQDLPLWLDCWRNVAIGFFFGWLVVELARGGLGRVGRTLQSKPLIYLGKISYGLYVFHMFAPLIVDSVRAGLGWAGRLALPVQIVTYAGLTFTLAALSWHCFEAPINRLKRFFPYHREPQMAQSEIRPAANASPLKSC